MSSTVQCECASRYPNAVPGYGCMKCLGNGTVPDDDCQRDPFSSRTCEKGTDTCTTRHAEADDRAKLGERLFGLFIEEAKRDPASEYDGLTWGEAGVAKEAIANVAGAFATEARAPLEARIAELEKALAWIAGDAEDDDLSEWDHADVYSALRIARQKSRETLAAKVNDE